MYVKKKGDALKFKPNLNALQLPDFAGDGDERGKSAAGRAHEEEEEVWNK